MRYLLLNATPHRGNTWRLALCLKDALQALSPDSAFEEIHLQDLSLPFCRGCSLCFRQGGEHCPHIGIIGPLVQKIEKSDGVILCATTFNMAPNALCKNLLDHLCFYLHRPRFFTSRAIVLSTTGGVGAGKTVKYIAGMLRAIGFNGCYTLPIMVSSWNAFTPGKKTRRRCEKLARRFHAEAASGRLRAPSALTLIPYNLFRGMSRHYGPGAPYETRDGAHWLDPARKNTPYDPAVPLRNPLKRALARLFCGLGVLAGRFLTVTYRK